MAAVAGALTIAKSRVVGLVVGALIVGGMVGGWLFELVLALLARS